MKGVLVYGGVSRLGQRLRTQASLAAVGVFGYIRRNRRLRRALGLLRTMPGLARVYRRLDPLTVNPRFREYRLEDLSPRAQAIHAELAAGPSMEASQ